MDDIKTGIKSGVAAKIAIVVILITAIGVVIWAKDRTQNTPSAVVPDSIVSQPPIHSVPPKTTLPRLVDLGRGQCIPCKMMAPVLAELQKEFSGILSIEYIDVGDNPEAAKQYGISVIPTQIFYDTTGKEIFRHEGFIAKEDILAKWKDLGYDFGSSKLPEITRWEPARKDERTKDQICYMCDGDINLKTAVLVKTDKGTVNLCGLHCYFIMYSCLTEDKTGFEDKVYVTDYAAGKTIPVSASILLYGVSESNGRPWIKAFADRNSAITEQQFNGGSIVAWNALRANELSCRCGFCDRACYPQDATKVLIDGVHSYGCCAHCAMGIATRTGKDIEVHQSDGLIGEIIVIKTLNGSVLSIDPPSSVAWFGKKKTADGKWVSAGCFHQGFFRTPENLRKWLEIHPFETGEIISIHQSLADKMKLSPQQIQKACKIGECAPK